MILEKQCSGLCCWLSSIQFNMTPASMICSGFLTQSLITYLLFLVKVKRLEVKADSLGFPCYNLARAQDNYQNI